MSELTNAIHRAVDVIERRASDARDDAQRRDDERQTAKIGFETLKRTVIRPVLAEAAKTLEKSKVTARVEERRDGAHQGDHLRLVIVPPERALHPGESTLIFGKGNLGVDVLCFHRDTDNTTEHYFPTKHIPNGEVTEKMVESILALVVRRMIDPAARTR